MLLSLTAQSLTEQLALWLGLVPVPVLHTQGGFMLARAVLEAAELAVFEGLHPATTQADLAQRTGLHPEALHRLLGVLAGAGYVRMQADGRYGLTRMARRFCLAESPYSVLPHLRFMLRCGWPWAAELPAYLRTGQGADCHERFSDEEWVLYQEAMASLARQVAPMAMRGLRLPPVARRPGARILDIGGAHGLFSAQILARHPGLNATVLDLPPACAWAAPRWQGHPLQGRIHYQPADALTADLGQEVWEVVMLSGLLHHFSAEAAAGLCQRIGAALAPGGLLIIQEFVSPTLRPGRRADLAAAVADLFFGLTSSAGNYSPEAYTAMMAQAGLRVERPRALAAMPGVWRWLAYKPA